MWFNSTRYAASIIYSITYGKDFDKDGWDDFFSLIDIIEGFVRDCMPGAHLVDTFPILDLLPDFLAPWRQQAQKKHEKEMKVKLFSIMCSYRT